MKKLKSILCLLLAGSLLFLAACGSNQEEEKNTGTPIGGGRYVETDITPPLEGRFASFLTADGTIVCFDEGLKTRYESADGGKSWTQTPGPGSGTDRYQEIQGGTLLPDGSLLAYIQGEGLVTIDAGGGSTPYPVSDIDEAIANGDSVMISLIQALGNDRLLLSYNIGGMVMQTQRSGPGGTNASQGQAPDGQMPPDGQRGQMPEGQMPPDGQGGQMPDRRVPDGDAPDAGGPVTRSDTQVGGRTGAGRMIVKTLLCEISTGQVIADLPVEIAAAAASDGTSLYLMDGAGSVKVYNVNDGTSAGKPDIQFGDGQGSGMLGSFARPGTVSGSTLALGGDGGLYAARDGNLLLADAGGTVSTVLESTAYSIGAPRNSVNSVFVLADGGIVVNLLVNGQTNHLYKYTWDENATVNPDKTLSVWSLEDNSFVRAAIAELRKKHPDASISYEVALEGDNAVSAADAIKTLNTRLLNGNGPDVILLDGCPVGSYADKGMLLDLGNLINTGDVYENLLAPYNTDGKLYCLPTQFLMPALMGSADALAKVQSLDDLVSLVVNGHDLPADGGMGAPGGSPFAAIDEGERAELYFTDLKELCNLLWLSSAPAIVSDNKLDTEALRSYLEAVKAISDKYGLTDTAQDGGRVSMRVAFSDGGAATELPGSLVRYTSQITNYGAFAAGNLQLLQMMMERDGSELALFPGLTSGAWQPSAVAGICADTKNPAFAAELVQAMLSLEVQQLNYGTGLPVTRTGIAAQVDGINERLAQDDRGTFTLDIGVLIGQLQVPSMGDTALTDMMWSSVEKCCKGEIGVDEAVKEIEQNVKNYLAERS